MVVDEERRLHYEMNRSRIGEKCANNVDIYRIIYRSKNKIQTNSLEFQRITNSSLIANQK